MNSKAEFFRLAGSTVFVAQEEVDIITEKLKPYHVSVSIVGFY